jgi:hypothetical protein
MLQRIIGIVGILAVAGTIVMVALSPRAEGFFPGMFDFLKRTPGTEEPGTIYAPEISVPEPDSIWTPIAIPDTLGTEQQIDTVSIE